MNEEFDDTKGLLSKYVDNKLLSEAENAVSGVCPLHLAVYDYEGRSVWISGQAPADMVIPQDLSENATLLHAADTIRNRPNDAISIDQFADGVFMAPIILDEGYAGVLAGFLCQIQNPSKKLADIECLLKFHARLISEQMNGKHAADDFVRELSARYEELSLVYGITDALDINKPLSEALKLVCTPILNTMDIDLLFLEVPDHGIEKILPQDTSKLNERHILADVLQKRSKGESSVIFNYMEKDLGLAQFSGECSHAIVVPLDVDGTPGCLILLRFKGSKRFFAGDGRLFEGIGRQIAVFLSNIHIADSRRQLLYSSIFGLSRLAESRDPETGEHLLRVSCYVRALAEHIKGKASSGEDINDEMVEYMFRTSPLHDIGKVGISDSILCKPGKLTEDEFELMKQHVVIGGDTLRDIEENMRGRGGKFLTIARQIAYGHHEKWDGSGYPTGLSGTNIPLSARIMALADVYDALTSKRCYKPAFSHEKARGIIINDSGSHFDPAVVDAFIAKEEYFVEVCTHMPDMGTE